ETDIEDLGVTNMFLITRDGAVHTPQLSSTILEGVTRRSILQIVADDGGQVHERPITLAEVEEGVADGSITEVFACGTAAVVTPIGQLKPGECDLTVGGGSAGPVTEELYTHLTDLQFGRRADDYGWMRRLVWPGRRVAQCSVLSARRRRSWTRSRSVAGTPPEAARTATAPPRSGWRSPRRRPARPAVPGCAR